MDYQTLRNELLAGSRLPNPTYSSPKISHLIQTCWLADPIERPTFTKIKENLHNSCPILNPDAKQGPNYYLSLKSDDDAMHIQYKMIQQCNPMFEKREDVPNKPTQSTQGASYSYFESKPSDVTNITTLNSTSNEADVLNYVDPEKEYGELGEAAEEATFLDKPAYDKDDVFSDQGDLDYNNYLKDTKQPSKKSILLVGECSHVV